MQQLLSDAWVFSTRLFPTPFEPVGSCFPYAPEPKCDLRNDEFIHPEKLCHLQLLLIYHPAFSFLTGENKSQEENHDGTGTLPCCPWATFSGDFSLGPASGPGALTKEYIASTLCPWLCLHTGSRWCHPGLSSTFPLKNHMEGSWGYSTGTPCLLLAPPTPNQLVVFRAVLLFFRLRSNWEVLIWWVFSNLEDEFSKIFVRIWENLPPSC